DDTCRDNRVRRQPGELAAFEEHRPGGRSQEATDGVQRAALAGTVGSDQRDDLSGADRKRDAPHGFDVSVRDAQIAHFEERAHAPSPRYAAMTAGSFATSAGVPRAITLPKFNTVIRSHTSITSRTLCSMSSTARPSRTTSHTRRT